MKILKSLFVALFIIAAFAVFGSKDASAATSPYVVTVSTFIPTGSAGEFTSGGYPNIAGGAKIRHFSLTNESATAQTVTIYKNCTSYTAASEIGSFTMPATIGTYQVFPDIITLDIYQVNNFCLRKSATGSVVRANILYQ